MFNVKVKKEFLGRGDLDGRKTYPVLHTVEKVGHELQYVIPDDKGNLLTFKRDQILYTS